MTRWGPEATPVEKRFTKRLNTEKTIVYAIMGTTLKLIDAFNKATPRKTIIAKFSFYG